jgi:hypothetical protein
MKNQIHNLLCVIALSAATIMSGCATPTDGSNSDSDFAFMLKQEGFKTGLQYAVLDFTKDDEELNDRIREITVLLMDASDGMTFDTIAEALLSEATKEIKFDGMTPQQALLANSIINLTSEFVQFKLNRIVEKGDGLTISEIDHLARSDVRQILGWIFDATTLHALGARAE